MKKTLFFAALAVVAMASCTKNELKAPSTGTEAEISFQPLVANATKATYLTTANMKDECAEFGVFAWYAKPSLTASGSTTLYMNNVKVTYTDSKNDATKGQGAWAPETPYYWPKNGTLSFDAYAPAKAHAETPISGSGKVSSESATGLKIENYTVAELAEQYDLLYSTRSLNKSKSTDGTNNTYDGVDIAFKHALSAIEVKAKTDKDYGTGTIKLNKITILKAYNKGSFTQGMTNAVNEATPAWTPTTDEVDYVLFDGDQALSTTLLTSPTISKAILLPQAFAHAKNNVSIQVDYSIKNDSGYLAQTQTFDLTATSGSENGGSSVSLTDWEIGKRYTYTLIFSLEDIYFAPSVTDWKDVTVNSIDVK